MVPCGLDGVVMTSAQKETGKMYNMEEVKKCLAGLLHQYLGRGASLHASGEASGDARPTRKS
jgi:lipoate-protein ligase B